ncbi:hypothetical protein CEXT_616651 [Caerostris extrusa]|uniref:Uncharacterized protein n=1 Tax=Caerostris extrusa TaxID=172846 RepID=A0AAV4V7I8_CAEEX|nr:hypothetical protein CEXT_616651 [Caerostris extrusa]
MLTSSGQALSRFTAQQDFEDTNGKVSQISIEDSFEEMTLQELPDEDDISFKIENIINNDITMTESIEFENDQGNAFKRSKHNYYNDTI